MQLSELEETRTRMRADAEQERASSAAEATDLVAAAQREADQLRLAAQQEATEMRTAATREVEQARAAADREVQEARRTLAVEKERLAREATDHHASAMGETRRLVEEAEQRRPPRRSGPTPATKQAGELRAATKKEADALISRARREAEQIVAAAKGQADTVRSLGRRRPRAEVERLSSEVARLAKRRDAITAQLSSLHEVIAGFGTDDDPASPAGQAGTDSATTES